MTTVSIKRAFGNTSYARVSLTPSASTATPYHPPLASIPTPYRPPIASTPIFVSIDGLLPGGRWLAHPLVVQVEEDDGEVLVTEHQFYMHASGPTVVEAIEVFKRIVSGYLDVHSSSEETLGPYLRDQLEYLRSAIRTI